MKRVLLCVLCIFWFLRPCLVLAQPAEKLTAKSEIPLRLASGFLIVVEGRIGPLSNLKFALDTGVTRSIVDRKVAAKLRLPRYPRRMFDFDRFLDIEWAVFPDIQFGPIRAVSASMAVGDLARFSRVASHVDALIGSDLLGLSNITIDYVAKSVLFDFRKRGESGESRSSDPACLTVEMQVQDRPVRLLVDTGFPEILLFEDRLRKRIPQLEIEDETEPFDVAGRLQARRVTLPSVRLGTPIANFRVLLAKGPPDNILPGVDGLLGTAALKARRIDINFASKTLAWEK